MRLGPRTQRDDERREGRRNAGDRVEAPPIPTGGSGARPPYYFIGQWLVRGERRLRAFVCSARGTLHLTRVHDDRSELTAEEIAECYTRIFPDLLRRLQHFSVEVPGLLKEPLPTSRPPTARTRPRVDGR